MTSLRMSGRRRGLVLGTLLVLAGCGSHDSSGPTGPSTTSSQSGADFGANNPRRVTAFGDSITFGVLEERKRVVAKLDTANSYPADLQGLLGPSWSVSNRGKGGEAVEDGARRIVSVLATDHPGFVLIMEGTNNASRCDDSVFIAENLRTMVDLAKANKTIPILGTIPPNFRNDPCAHDTIDASNALIRRLASAEGIVLAEIFDGMNDRNLFGLSLDRDPLHPNDAGYRVMAGIWFDALKRAVPGGFATTALHPKKK